MSEKSMYEAQKKKLQGLCDEHDLIFKFDRNKYPIILTIKPVTGCGEQMSMLEDNEDRYCAPESSMTWIYEDGAIRTKVTGGTFTIAETVRNKIKNIFMKLCQFGTAYFFRYCMETHLVKDEDLPNIDEDSPEEDEDSGTSLPDVEFDDPDQESFEEAMEVLNDMDEESEEDDEDTEEDPEEEDQDGD